MKSKSWDYDVIVIGSGPAGQKAAIQSAKLGKRVILIDLNQMVGGVCLHDGTIPSKSFREAIMHFSGYRLRQHFGEAYRIKTDVQMKDLTKWSAAIVDNIEQVLRSQLLRNRVELMCGFGKLEGPNSVVVRERNKFQTITGEFIVLATGTAPRRPTGFEFDNGTIVDSNGILYLEEIPRSIAIVGGGVIGCEYGSMLSTLGVDVTIIEVKDNILASIDSDIREVLSYRLRQQGSSIMLREKVISCKKTAEGRAVLTLESGKRVVSDVVLVSAGRTGNTKELGLENVSISATADGMIEVNDNFQTTVPNIYAVGDVTGASGLASTAIEHGRKVACHAFNVDDPFPNFPLPYGIYSIPEIAMVGKTESELTKNKIPYEIGVARYSELERGKINGDTDGVLKLLFHSQTMEILGVHIIGEDATELIHIGQMVLAQKNTLPFLVHAVFNYPTLSQAYKVAALDGFNKVMDARGT